MSKIYVPLPSKDNVSLYLQQCFDGFFVGIKDYSENFNRLIDLDELDEIIKICKEKEIYICLNRLYYNEEIDTLAELVKELIKYDITGICYTDIGVLNILNELEYKGKIIWVSNHLGTNSKTINFLEKRNVSKVLLSTEISVDEIIKINNNTNIETGAVLYGYLNMATSSRKLLTNYFEYVNKDKTKNNYVIKDKLKKDDYILVEDKNTNFFTGKVLNGIKYFPSLIKSNIDFIFLDDYLLNENNFYNVIEAFSSLRNAPDDENFINSLDKVVESNTFCDTFDGFLNKKTVYKVEDYE